MYPYELSLLLTASSFPGFIRIVRGSGFSRESKNFWNISGSSWKKCSWKYVLKRSFINWKVSYYTREGECNFSSQILMNDYSRNFLAISRSRSFSFMLSFFCQAFFHFTSATRIFMRFHLLYTCIGTKVAPISFIFIASFRICFFCIKSSRSRFGSIILAAVFLRL